MAGLHRALDHGSTITPTSGTPYCRRTASSPPEATYRAAPLAAGRLPHATADSLDPSASARVARGSAERLSQSLTVPSREAETTWWPDCGLHATADTGAVCALYALIVCSTQTTVTPSSRACIRYGIVQRRRNCTCGRTTKLHAMSFLFHTMSRTVMCGSQCTNATVLLTMKIQSY